MLLKQRRGENMCYICPKYSRFLSSELKTAVRKMYVLLEAKKKCVCELLISDINTLSKVSLNLTVVHFTTIGH